MMKTVWKLIFTVLSLCFLTPAFSQVDVLNQHNNISRTGWNAAETKLTKTNVKAGSFGLLTSRTVDDQIYAQPLVVSGVDINGTPTNVVYVETVKNTIYAFDADNGTAPVIWQRNLNTAGWREPYNTDMTGACNGTYNDFSPINSAHGGIGIVGTPVIDKPSNTIWFVHREMNPGSNVYKQYLHAIDIRTGAEKPNSPIAITAQIAGAGPGNVGGSLLSIPKSKISAPACC